MKFEKKDALILGIPLLIVLIAYPFLPAMIPRQFHMNGEPPSYMAKEFLFLIGLLPYAIFKSRQFKKR
jgi:uncharacterized membrane protein